MTTKAERTRRRILDATAHALATRGYGATSVKSIADAVGMQDASIYYHFASKDELVLEVLRIGTALAHDAVLDAVAALGEDPDPLDALRAAIVAHTVAVLGGDDYPRANVRTFGQLPPTVAEPHVAGHRAYGDVWRRLLQPLLDDGRARPGLDPTAVRLLILGALNWSIEWYDPDGELSPTALAEQMADLTLHGILAGTR